MMKYLSPSMEFSIAVLACFTLEYFFTRTSSMLRMTYAAALLLGVVMLWFLYQGADMAWSSTSRYAYVLVKSGAFVMAPCIVVFIYDACNLNNRTLALGFIAALLFDVNFKHKVCHPCRGDP